MTARLGIHSPVTIGAFVSVLNESALTAIDVSDLTLGTMVYVTSENLYFQIVTDNNNDLIWQQVDFGGGGGGGSPLGLQAKLADIFQKKTNLNPQQWSMIVNEPFNELYDFNNAGYRGWKTDGSGTAQFLYQNTGGGVLADSVNSSSDVQWGLMPPGIGSFLDGLIGTNIGTKRWMSSAQLRVDTVPSSTSMVGFGIHVFDGAVQQMMGVGFSAAEATWKGVYGSYPSVAGIADLGVSIDSSGAVWVTVYVANFDTNNIVANADVFGSGTDVVIKAANTMPTGVAGPAFWLWSATSGGERVAVRNVVVCTEL
jgi:hypothetical protein